MKTTSTFHKSIALLSLLGLTGGVGMTSIASAHEADCPLCKLSLVQNTTYQDNKVLLRTGNKRIEYRCVYCAVRDQDRYRGNLEVQVPSETVGKPIVLSRIDGQWNAPEGVVFLNAFKKHKDCAFLSRAFSTRAAFDEFVGRSAIETTEALTLEQFVMAVRNR